MTMNSKVSDANGSLFQQTPAFVQGQAYPLGPGSGIMDPFLRTILMGPEMAMYSTFVKEYTLAAAAGDITRATGKTEGVFVTGQAAVPVSAPIGEGMWWSLTGADTNVLGIGSGYGWLSQVGFIASMMKVEVGEPFQRAATGAIAAADAKYENAFLRPGVGYNERLKADVVENTSFSITYGISGSNGTNILGKVSFYGSAGGLRGGSLAQNSNYNDAVYGRPFLGVLMIPPRATDNLFAMSDISGQAVTIANIAAVPTSVSTSAGVLLTGGNVFVPGCVIMEGYRACMDAQLWCVIPGVSVVANAPQGVRR